MIVRVLIIMAVCGHVSDNWLHLTGTLASCPPGAIFLQRDGGNYQADMWHAETGGLQQECSLQPTDVDAL